MNHCLGIRLLNRLNKVEEYPTFPIICSCSISCIWHYQELTFLMIPTIVSGLILMKRRRMMEVFPIHLRKLWKEWELTGAALFSLTLQIVLILSGNRRKYCSGTWVRFVAWFAYMLADSVATIALGILSNDLGQIYDDGGHINVANELRAFWAPFFLLHLGGPDTITAYSLEDNELYLRHLFWLIVQTTATLYILLLAWTSSNLSYLSIVMILVGCIKYGERTLALWKASKDELRDSILPAPDSDLRYTKLMQKYTMKVEEGYSVEILEMREGQADLDVTVPRRTAESEDDLVKADALFQTFKSLFADLILSYNDLDSSQCLFEDMSDENAFNVIGIELGFMYDLVYTKAPAIYTLWGFVRRFITFFLTCLVFTFFILDDKFRHDRTDFVVTLLLLVVAIFLEIYAALIVLASDQTRVWLIKKRMTSILQFMNSFEEWFKWFKVPRWSNSIAQYSLLWLSLEEKLSLKIIEEFRYKEINDFSTKYRKLIFDHVKEKFEQIFYEEGPAQSDEQISYHVKEKSEQSEVSKKKRKRRSKSALDTALREFYSQRGKGTLDKYKKEIGQVDLEWGISTVEFDKSILIWHMATEICYNSENHDDVNLSRDFSLHMSRYMCYLLVICPSFLSDRIDIMRIRHTRAEAMKFFKEQPPAALAELRRKLCSCSGVEDVEKRRIKACKLLVEVKTDVPPSKVKGDSSKSVLFEACRLASRLNTISDPKIKWDLMRDMWLELLAYAACHSRDSQHGQQLRRGGELLTHVWLLMAHFGLTEQCQTAPSHAPRARLVTR
ncbi:hypothetical protein SLEP1_g25658 [Rubroshorea leprosula]|uniref:DUF4220 domain-containing protein n=1 Tax=Rubroshorea leprosula TaxID=152421 RepID=A0AAV5JU06_9ROSI|nr:hypothetical protein SLEP1_g25658 [Rubroshorea leprosula]